MKWTNLEKHFSSARLGRYLTAYGGSQSRAAQAYTCNILLAEAMLPLLNALEVAVRNGVHYRLSRLYDKPDWWSAWSDGQFRWQLDQISEARRKLASRKEPITVDKIIAELHFGFWSSLYNKSFQMVLWKDLRLVFPHCPQPQRQRHTVSAAINHVRDLRNRVSHHEPVLWLTPCLLDQHKAVVQTLCWIDPALVDWLAPHDRLQAVWEKYLRV